MRIEIQDGLFGSNHDLKKSINKLKNKISDNIDSLKSTERQISNASGGPTGNLSVALNNIQGRIRTENSKLSELNAFASSAEAFFENTINTDKHVAALLDVNQEKFFDEHPRIRDIVNKNTWWGRIKEGWNWVKDKIKKVVDVVVDFVKEHWVELLIGVVCIVIGAVLTALSGGTFLAAFGAALAAGLKAAAISAAVSGVLSAGIAFLTGDDPLEAFKDGLAEGFMWGGMIFSVQSVVKLAKAKNVFSKLKNTFNQTKSKILEKIPFKSGNNKIPGKYRNWKHQNLGESYLKQAKYEKFRDFIKRNFRTEARIGDGSTASAVRFEKRTGILLSPNGHDYKLVSESNKLKKIINSKALDKNELKLAKKILKFFVKTGEKYHLK